VADRDLVTRDFTLTALRRALTEVLVHFPVYRLYITPGGRTRRTSASSTGRWPAPAAPSAPPSGR
jgi:maltooligosyltrehalose synthase